MKLAINSIYSATEGEGIRVGTPQIFVRFQGCAIGCLNCDSKETWEFTDHGVEMASALKLIERLKLKTVSITGGDPLHPKISPQVLALVKELKAREYFVNIEASGMRVVDKIFDLVDFISFDFKTPSTGVRPSRVAFEVLYHQYGSKAQIKAVMADPRDFNAAVEWRSQFDCSIPWVLTPCLEAGNELDTEWVKKLQHLNEALDAPMRVILQQHKVVYSSEFGDF